MHQAVAEFVQKQIARSRVGTHLAIKLKRQCDAIVGARLGTSTNLVANGERWLIEHVAPRSQFFIDVGARHWPAPMRSYGLEDMTFFFCAGTDYFASILAMLASISDTACSSPHGLIHTFKRSPAAQR